MDGSMFKQIIDKDTETLTIYVDGAPVQAIAGETVAGVVLRLSSPVIRKTPVKGQMRAPYCLMGVCFECLAIVDGEASSQMFWSNPASAESGSNQTIRLTA